MKKLLSVFVAITLTAALALNFTSCDEGESPEVGAPVCQHRDADDNSLCDKCSESYTDGKDLTGEHTHDYTVKNTDSKYLDKAANCENAATYFYSCSCGEKGTETFASGNGNGHNYTVKNTDSKYLDKAADCENAATYFYSCSCGEKGTETFTHGSENGHSTANGECTGCGRLESSIGLEYTLNNDGNGYTVTDVGTFAGENLVIDLYNNQPVTSISPKVFENCTSLTSVVIGEGVTSVGQYAFRGCNSLNSITIPFVGATKDGTSNTHFGYIFGASTYSYNERYVPSSLKTVIITGGSSIASDAFYWCTSLTSVKIPDSVTSIGYRAFSYCTGLTSVVIGDRVTSIGSHAFEGCYKLVEVYNLSSLIITKGDWDNGYIGYYALDIYISLDEHSKQWTTDDGFIFYEDGDICYLLGYKGVENDIILPKDCSEKNYKIYQYAFIDCTSLTSVEIPGSVTSIGSDAFCWCTSLTSVEIPDSVTSIGPAAFYNCTSLMSIKYRGTEEEWNAISKGSGWNSYTGEYTITYNYTGE